ncbi:MAG TPA: GAF domain-containing protein [Phycisphaerae bacterium]|nr:GAF domain-containing protein [Phycisphaerae bacterium]
MSLRPYESLRSRMPASGGREERMRVFVDFLWDALHPTGVSWLGFYVSQGTDELILGPRRDKPACSPIGLHGACGQSFRSGKPLIVHDVKDLGPNYIACDPRDRSELVLPLFGADGKCWGVFDVDSWEPGSFDETDAREIKVLLESAGLSQAHP